VTVSVLPRRDAAALAHLAEAARRAQPVLLARERGLPVPGRLAGSVPEGALVRGTLLRVAGADAGAGATTVAFELAAAATAAGEWAAMVELDATVGAMAAAEAGVTLARFAVVRRVPPTRWATVLSALIDGVSLVVAEVPRGLRAVDARRLAARARERGTVLVAFERGVARWPAEAALTLHAAGSAWRGFEQGAGVLARRSLEVRVVGRGAAARELTTALTGTG
jgi:hypothetical protein